MTRKYIKKVTSIVLLVLVVGLLGNLAYMNLRPADPILPGWEEFDRVNFDRYQKNGEAVLVEIYASWCPTCKAQHEALKTLESSGLRPKVRAIRIDFDRDSTFRRDIGINYTGAMLIFKNGDIVAQAAGLVTPQSIKNFLLQNDIADKAK